MAVAFDATSAPTPQLGDVSWTHTPVGAPRGVVVAVATTVGVDDVTAVLYGGVPMVEVPGSPNIKTATEAAQAHTFALGAGVPPGPQTVTVQLRSQGSGVLAQCWTVTADADTEVVDVGLISSNAVANPSVLLELGGRTAWCAIVLMSGQDSVAGITPLSGWAGDQEFDLGAMTAGFYRYLTVGSTDVTAGWTQTSDDALAIAVAIAEVEAAVVELVVDDSTHSHDAASPTLAVGGDLEPQGAEHAHSADSPAPTQASTLSADGAAHGHSADSPPLVDVAWAFLGDSNTDAYGGSDQRGAGTPYASVILNWPELLAQPVGGQPRVPAHHRGLRVGGWGSWGEPRRADFEHNWARSDAVAQDVIDDQLPGVLAQIAAGTVTHVAYQTPQNDWHLINNPVPQRIYDSPDGGVTEANTGVLVATRVTAYVNRVITVIDAMVAEGVAGIVVLTVSDPMAYPPVHALYPNATRRGYVTAAITSVQNQIAAHVASVNSAEGRTVASVRRWDEDVYPAIFGTYSGGEVTVAGVQLTATLSAAADSDPYNVFQHASAPHQSTMMNGVTANTFIAAANELPGISIQPFSNQEIRENAGIVGIYDLIPADAAHGHAAGSPTLSVAFSLAVADAAHGHEADAPALAQASTLAADGAEHAHSAEEPTLSHQYALSADSATHGHAAEVPTLDLGFTLSPEDASHAHGAESLTLAHQYAIAAQGAGHAHSAEEATLTPAGSLAVQTALHAHAAEAPDLVQAHVLALASALHAHVAGAPTLGEALELAVDDALHSHWTDEPEFTESYLLAVADAIHAHATESPGLEQANVLAVQDAIHAHTSEVVWASDEAASYFASATFRVRPALTATIR